MNIKNKKKILIVCHDAGGAEIVSAFVKKNIVKYDFFCITVGPAEKIFKRKGLNKLLLYFKNKKSYKSFLKSGNFDMVLTGTSWASSMEFYFIKAAKQLGIKTAVYLEHWINYCERFGYPKKNWKDNLPDEIWAGDIYALKLAKKNFKKIRVKFIPNLYFKEIKNEYSLLKSKLKNKKASGILFMSEPLNVYGSKNNISVTEYDVLNKIFETLFKNSIQEDIIIRMHPSEKKDKYNSIISSYKNKLNIIKSNKRNILEDLARAKTVIGINSMALVISNICGKKTISFIPDKKSKCSLPIDNILKIKRVADLMKAI